MSESNWGHGPNIPLQMFSELEIVSVMRQHHPAGSDGRCSCGHRGAVASTRFTAEHLLWALKEYRLGHAGNCSPFRRSSIGSQPL